MNKFAIMRWMRKHGFGWLIPFHFIQDDYDDGQQVLYVYRWGRVTREVWLWPDYRDFDVYYRASNAGMNRRNLYKLITAEARQGGGLTKKPVPRRL